MQEPIENRESRVLLDALLDGKGMDHSTTDPTLIETHISWVVLLGEFAYKIKKPLDLGFLDFSTLTLRKQYCEDEVRLNARTAPDIYLGVLPISGDAANPRLGDASEPFEYAVKMRRFSQDCLLSGLVADNRLSPDIARQLGRMVAEFHNRIAIDAPSASHGTPDKIMAEAVANLDVLDSFYPALPQLKNLREWTSREFARLDATFSERHALGFVRECHGDMHLANLLYIDGQCLAFDCLEFNSDLRWIDTQAEIAFTIMDLDSCNKQELAGVFLNSYLEWSGDFAGLQVLPFYLVYRALVRAKVAAIRLNQSALPDRALQADVSHHIEVAQGYTHNPEPALILMSGLSGSGKSFVAKGLAPQIGAIHIRSDIERKRLHGIDLLADSGGTIYTKAHSNQTFQCLLELVLLITRAGYPVIIDATFIGHHRRKQFTSQADALNLPWLIIECRIDRETARQRLAMREGDASEAGIEQFDAQSRNQEPMTREEMKHSLQIDTTGVPNFQELAESIILRLKSTG